MKTLRAIRFAFLFGALALASANARGDSAPLLVGAGGAVKPMRAHPSVRMVSEEVYVKLPECRVEARFVFRNEGPSKIVTMGFPELTVDSGMSRSHDMEYRNFRAFVDGRPLKVTRVIQRKTHPGDGSMGLLFDEEINRIYWWVKRVHFARGQTRTVVCRYRGGERHFDSAYGHGFCYILTTGAAWKGPIGRARIVCDIRGLQWRRFGEPLFEPSGYRRIGDTVVWNFRNFEPKKNINIYWEYCFTDIKLNGKVLGDNAWPSSERAWSYRQGQELWASARLASALLGFDSDHPDEPPDDCLTIVKPGRVVRLMRGKRWVEITVGSRWLRTSAGRFLMPGKAYMDKKRHLTIVPLTPLMKAFGGKARFKKGTMIVTLPKKD